MKPNRRVFIIVALAVAGGMLLLWNLRHLVWYYGPIDIVAAEYGVPGRTCTSGAEFRKLVGELCGGFRPRCLVSVGARWCEDRDPAPGALKTLTVDYRCGTTAKRATAIDGTGLALACP